jgi:hypothetical protein
VVTEGTLFSAFTGVLAGFAFTAIVLLLIAALDPTSPASRLLRVSGRALVGSFFGLLIMTMLYAGEGASSVSCGLSISENTILSGGFAGVSILYYYAIVLMLEAVGIPRQEEPALSKGLAGLARFGRITALVVPVLVLAMVYDATTSYTAIKYGPESGLTALGWLGIGVLALQVTACFWALWVSLRSQRPGRFARGEHSSSILLPFFGLGLPVASAIAFIAIDTTEPATAVIPPACVAIILVVTCACTTNATIYLALTRPGLTASQNQKDHIAPLPRSASDENQPGRRIPAPLARGFSTSASRFVPAVFAFASILFVARLIRQLIWPPE